MLGAGTTERRVGMLQGMAGTGNVTTEPHAFSCYADLGAAWHWCAAPGCSLSPSGCCKGGGWWGSLAPACTLWKVGRAWLQDPDVSAQVRGVAGATLLLDGGWALCPLGAGCGAGAALLVVADVAHSPLQAVNWAPLNVFPKPRSGPRMVTTSHCLDLMIRLVQQVRDCQGSVHPPGLGQDLGEVRDALTPLAENGLSVDGCRAYAQIWGGWGVDASALLSCTARRGQQLADAVAI